MMTILLFQVVYHQILLGKRTGHTCPIVNLTRYFPNRVESQFSSHITHINLDFLFFVATIITSAAEPVSPSFSVSSVIWTLMSSSVPMYSQLHQVTMPWCKLNVSPVNSSLPANSTINTVLVRSHRHGKILVYSHTEAGVNEANITETGVNGVNITETGVNEANITETGVNEANVTETGVNGVNITETGATESTTETRNNLYHSLLLNSEQDFLTL